MASPQPWLIVEVAVTSSVFVIFENALMFEGRTFEHTDSENSFPNSEKPKKRDSKQLETRERSPMTFDVFDAFLVFRQQTLCLQPQHHQLEQLPLLLNCHQAVINCREKTRKQP